MYMQPVNLICLHYAGGNAYSFNAFRPYLDGRLNMITPELPGRGLRYGEPLLTDVYAMANDVFSTIAHRLEEPFAIYGHSMGAIVAYLLARRIEEEKLPPPVHLFCSGSRAPSVPCQSKYYNLPRAEFIARLKELGGSPDEVLGNAEVMEFYIPIIRADFEAVETYQYQPGEKLNTPVTVLISKDDRISYADAEAWQQETYQPVSVLNFPGDHFFILDHAYDICRVIMRRLLTARLREASR